MALGFRSIYTTKSAIRNHIKVRKNHELSNTDLNGFKVLRIFNSEYDTKIQVALFIKKHNLQLNRQFYTNGLFFTNCLLS